MGQFSNLGTSQPVRLKADPNHPALILPHHALRQLLEFTRHNIHDIVNCEIAKREVLGYYKLKCDIQRRCEATNLERQWTGIHA